MFKNALAKTFARKLHKRFAGVPEEQLESSILETLAEHEANETPEMAKFRKFAASGDEEADSVKGHLTNLRHFAAIACGQHMKRFGASGLPGAEHMARYAAGLDKPENHGDGEAMKQFMGNPEHLAGYRKMGGDMDGSEGETMRRMARLVGLGDTARAEQVLSAFSARFVPAEKLAAVERQLADLVTQAQAVQAETTKGKALAFARAAIDQGRQHSDKAAVIVDEYIARGEQSAERLLFAPRTFLTQGVALARINPNGINGAQARKEAGAMLSRASDGTLVKGASLSEAVNAYCRAKGITAPSYKQLADAQLAVLREDPGLAADYMSPA